MGEFKRVELTKKLKKKYDRYMKLKLSASPPEVDYVLFTTTMILVGKLLELDKE